MVRKRLDDRVRSLIERSVLTGQRSMLLLVGDHGKDQVPNLHQILTKCSVRERPKVLWCYKKELGFSTHRMKRMKKIKRDKARGLSNAAATGATTANADGSGSTADNFELFISQTDINWCYYKDSHRVLGTTVQMLARL
jgi:N-acetyltransferase 10